MRTASLIFLAALLPFFACAQTPPSAEVDDASEVLGALEARLNESEYASFQFAFSIPTEEKEDWQTALEGHVALGPNNRTRIESSGVMNGLGASPRVVSDGMEMTGGRNGVDYPDFSNHPVPQSLRADMIGSLIRWSIAAPIFTLVQGSPLGYNNFEFGPDESILEGDPAARVEIHDASWGQTETFNGIGVRPLTFSVIHPNEYESQVTLWLDLETGLPVRQSTTRTLGGSPDTNDVTYSNWSFEAVDDSTFALPASDD